MRFDTVIKNAIVYDGNGTEGKKLDIAVTDDKIAKVADNIESEANEIINAEGKILCPGFIDVHSHDDFAVFTDPEMKAKIYQGVTTSISGNCGGSVIPYNVAIEYGSTFNDLSKVPEWSDIATYNQRFNDNPASINIGMLVGHCMLRYGLTDCGKNIPLDGNCRKEMNRLIEKGLEDGMFGLSLGLAYFPGKFASTQELIDSISIMRGNNALFSVHMRDEGKKLLDSIKEVIEISEKSGVPAQISHFNARGRDNFHLLDEAISLINDANNGGLSIGADYYSYNSGSTTFTEVMTWNLLSTSDKRKPKYTIKPSEVIIMSSKKYPQYMGKSIEDVAIELNMNPEDAGKEISTNDPSIIVALLNFASEENISKSLKAPFTMVGSDGVPTLTGYSNPRLYGTFPRVIRKFVREKNVMNLSEAVYKMTGLPAQTFGIKNRGIIKEGAYADIVLFDYDKIADKGDYVNPMRQPEGILDVFVNGEHSVKDAKHTGKRSGKALIRK
jgi:N-acyl-D-amino-acid deacylase